MAALASRWSCGTCVALDTKVSSGPFERAGERLVLTCPPAAAGEILEVGPGVAGLKKGDRVALEAGLPCGQCELCKTGRYNACPDVVFFSTPPYHGMLTRYHAHPAAWVHRLPDSISYEEGALLEPLVVALAGIERAELRLGDPLLIWCAALDALPFATF